MSHVNFDQLMLHISGMLFLAPKKGWMVKIIPHDIPTASKWKVRVGFPPYLFNAIWKNFILDVYTSDLCISVFACACVRCVPGFSTKVCTKVYFNNLNIAVAITAIWIGEKNLSVKNQDEITKMCLKRIALIFMKKRLESFYEISSHKNSQCCIWNLSWIYVLISRIHWILDFDQFLYNIFEVFHA